jgi:5S rRNA maturation endonuclease (ribonuclease M5)
MNWTVGTPLTARHFFGSAEIFDEDQVGDPNDFKIGGYYDDVYSRVFLGRKKIRVPDEILSEYPLLEDSPFEDSKEEIESYFMSRGIRPDILWEYEIRHDPSRHLIIFPMIDTDGEAYRLHVKLVLEKTFWYLTPELLGCADLYEPWGRKDYWFGIQFLDPALPVILVESETDLLRLRSLGVDNVLATCGAINKWKVARIPNHTIYLGFDSDNAGGKFTMKAIELLKGRRLFRLNWNIVDITRYTKVKRLERKEPAKDAGDLETLEQFEYVMENKVSVGEISPIVTRGYRDIWA